MLDADSGIDTSNPSGQRDLPEVQRFAAQIDSWFMRWGLRHSFGEGCTVQEAEQLVDGIPFASVRTEVDSISMAIWLER